MATQIPGYPIVVATNSHANNATSPYFSLLPIYILNVGNSVGSTIIKKEKGAENSF